jgi:hypothetical protein
MFFFCCIFKDTIKRLHFLLLMQGFTELFPKGQDLVFEKNIIPATLEIIKEGKVDDESIGM